MPEFQKDENPLFSSHNQYSQAWSIEDSLRRHGDAKAIEKVLRFTLDVFEYHKFIFVGTFCFFSFIHSVPQF